MSRDNNTFEIRKIYKKIHKLFSNQFGVSKTKKYK